MINSPAVYFINTFGAFLLYPLFLFYIWFIEKNQEKAFHVILSGILSAAAAYIIKIITSVPRPFVTDRMGPMAGYINSPSFPSLHTTLAFAIATTVFLHQKKLGTLLLIIAFFLGWGRVLANVHYPLDIIGGAFLGSSVAFLIDKYHIKNY